MNATSHTLTTLADTAALAARVAPALRAGDTVLLSGDLGTGKTALAQYLIRALSVAEVEVTSPTFTVLQTYPVRLSDGSDSEIYHYDLYRIEHASALAELGIDDAERAVRLIEWPDRLGYGFTPDSWISIHLTLEHGVRTAQLRSFGALATRLERNAA